jgi:pimeloyl-ACP methyl ester carboxylesterase
MELYYSDEHVVLSSNYHNKKTLVISFSPLIDENRNMGKDDGFGVKFFESNEISAVYVIPKWNHWYQYEYIESALNILKCYIARFEKVVLYGVSMGGYGVLKYANYLAASSVISISPQAALSGPRSTFDTRFGQFWEKIENISDDWLYEKAFPLNTAILYDRFHADDNAHAEIILNHVRHAKAIHLPFSGHEVFAVLNESGILSKFILALIESHTDYSSLVNSYRKVRGESGIAWMYAALNSQSRGRHRAAAMLFQRSISTIEWRKKSGLNIDKAKARMTVMAFVGHCMATGRLESFFEMYSRFSDNKIIEIDLGDKYLEGLFIAGKREEFIAGYKSLQLQSKTASRNTKNLISRAVAAKFISANDL